MRLLIFLVIVTLFNLWWYGAFENLFKSNRVYNAWEDEMLFSIDAADEEAVDQYYKKVFSSMTTEAVIQNLLRNTSALSGSGWMV